MAQSNLPTCEGDRAAWTDCFGSHTYANGNKYVGEYKDGKRNGQFTVTYANGNKYVGEFKADKYNGQGHHTYPSGNEYVGEYKDGKKNGRGIKFLANGKVDQPGIWKDGVLVQSKFIDVATFTRVPNLSNSASNQAQRRKTEDGQRQPFQKRWPRNWWSGLGAYNCRHGADGHLLSWNRSAGAGSVGRKG